MPADGILTAQVLRLLRVILFHTDVLHRASALLPELWLSVARCMVGSLTKRIDVVLLCLHLPSPQGRSRIFCVISVDFFVLPGVSLGILESCVLLSENHAACLGRPVQIGFLFFLRENLG